jgi:glyoxalase family protein
MAGDVAFAVPPDALPFWRARLAEAGVDASDATRGGEARLHLTAPDGLPLALVATAAADPDAAWADGPVPAEHALCGFYGTTLHVPDPGPVADLLTEVFGWTEPAASVEDAAEDAGAGDALRRVTGTDGALGRVIDLHATDAAARAGAGTIHHIAFRVPDDAAQRAYRAALTARGLFVTDVKDRQYFRSIYFRDARHTGGVLFEIATDGPGFTDDEPVATLGTALKLPPWLEERRAEIARRLPALDRP